MDICRNLSLYTFCSLSKFFELVTFERVFGRNKGNKEGMHSLKFTPKATGYYLLMI